MIVMAVFGGCDKDEEKAYHALVKELGESRVRRLNLGFLPDKAERARRLRLETAGRYSDDIVTLVFGVKSFEESCVLRKIGAFVCHHYTALTRVYDEVPIAIGDFIVSESRQVPPHVVTIVDAFSECLIRKRALNRQRRAKNKDVA